MAKRLHNAMYAWLDSAVAFLAAVLILLAEFAAMGVYPFGEHTIVGSDLYLQYLPIMAELQSALHGDGSIFYTFHAALGTNAYALHAYQNASPITWLFLLLFPRTKLVLCATLLIACKLGLVAATMCYYLRSTVLVPSRNMQGVRACLANAAPRVALACLFALCGYSIAYYFNVMWLDTLILLPLVVLGLRHLIEGQGVGLYTVALALMLFTGYYLGLMMCVFLLAYFVVYFLGQRKTGLVHTCVRMLCCSLLAAGMAAVVLVPTLLALSRTGNFASLGEGMAGFLYWSIPVHVAQLLPGSPVTVLDGPPNVYSGLVCLILLAAFALNKGIEMRKRIAWTVFASVLFVSTNVVPLDVFWQLLHAPNSLPSRYSFVLSFVLVEIAAESFAHVASLRKHTVLAALAAPLALCVVVLLSGGAPAANAAFMWFCVVALLVLYAFVFLALRSAPGPTFGAFLALVVAFEVVLVSFNGIASGGIVQEDRVFANQDEVAELLAIANEKDPSARTEILGTDHLNAPFVYGYQGVSVFASSVSSSTYMVLNALFNSANARTNQLTYRTPNPIADAIANVRFYISFETDPPASWVQKVAQVGGCTLYENPYHTALGYMLPESMASFDFGQPHAQLLDNFVHQACDVQGAGSSSQAALDAWDTAFLQLFSERLGNVQMQGNKVSGTVRADSNGVFMASIPYDPGWQVTVDGVTVQETNALQYFISFPLSAGQHEIKMVFFPQGLGLGCAVSVLSLLGFAVLMRLKRSTR